MSDLYYGIYRGICKENEDPENYKRIKLLVPQVLGSALSEWAWPCLPVTSNSNHPDHQEHTAAQIAALLTTTPVSVTDSRGDTETVPALTVVAKAGAGTLKHPKKTDADTDELWNDEQETNTTAEHSPHRLVPRIDQGVWVMFEGGDANFPVWIGVY
jgi:hypothetical protein